MRFKNIFKLEKRVHYSIHDIAATIIEYSNSSNQPINHHQLQKFLFVIQVEYYQAYNKLLFPEEFQMWAYGPVNYKLWQVYSYIGRHRIKNPFKGEAVDSDELYGFISQKFDLLYEVPIYNLIETIKTIDISKTGDSKEGDIISNQSIKDIEYSLTSYIENKSN